MSSSSASVPLESISKVQDVDKIVDSELARAKQKQDELKQEQSTKGQQTKILRSSSQRAQEYSYLVGVAVIALTACAILATVNTMLNSGLISMFIALIIAGGGIWIYLGYMNIIKRDKMDFDQIGKDSLIDTAKLVTPTTADTLAKGETGTGKPITSPVLACTGKECCSELAGTVWDPATYRCKIKPDKTVEVLNGSFGLPAVAPGSWVVKPVPNWTLLGTLYIVNGKNGNFNQLRALPPGATQYIAMQGAKSATQTITFKFEGTYQLSFYACPRNPGNHYDIKQQLTAKINGASITTTLVPTSEWTQYTVSFVIESPGPYPLVLSTNSTGGDTSVLVTNVKIVNIS